MAHHVEQVQCPVDVRARHQRRLLGALGRQYQAREHLLRMQCEAHRQRPADRAQFAGQGQLAGELMADQARCIDLSAGGQNAHGDRQVETARVLGQVGRGQVDGDFFVVGKLQPGILDRRAHPFTGFLHFHIGQANQRETRQAVGQVDFDRDSGCFKPEQRPALHQ